MRRRQRTRTDRGNAAIQRTLVESLTDRQRTTLTAAFHAGYFEWPRLANGNALAESLGVAPPTFHQHLRAAEQKVLDAVLSASLVEVGESG
jgi:predicted DNA binding protein